jgi:hypothetical protein
MQFFVPLKGAPTPDFSSSTLILVNSERRESGRAPYRHISLGYSTFEYVALSIKALRRFSPVQICLTHSGAYMPRRRAGSGARCEKSGDGVLKENTNLGSKMEGAYALDRRADSLALGCEQEESISPEICIFLVATHRFSPVQICLTHSGAYMPRRRAGSATRKIQISGAKWRGRML